MAKLNIIIATFILFTANIAAQTTAFTYQGSLSNGGVAANGSHDFQFLLFDAAAGGSQIGSTVSANGVAVSNGIFSVSLDFGNQFPGTGRFLEIRVQPSGSTGFTTLTPRQPVTSSPYSVKTLTADTAVNTQQLGGVPAGQYLQTTGNGSGLTNLNAGSVATGTLANARLGQIPTANIADAAVTGPKIAAAQVVKGVNGLTDNVTLAQGSNITITPSGNTLTIASTGGGGGVGGSGAANSIPVFTAGTTIGNSLISQSGGTVQLPNAVSLAATASGNNVSFGSPASETGMTISGPIGRADLRFDGSTLKLVAGPAGGPPPLTSGLSINSAGNVGIGTAPDPGSKLAAVGSGSLSGLSGSATLANGVNGTSSTGFGVSGTSTTNIGVYGSSTSGEGVYGSTVSGSGVRAFAITPGSIALNVNGSSWFKGDTTPLSAANAGIGTGMVMGSSGNLGYIQAFDYGAGQTRILALNNSGGNVGIGTTAPTQTLDVNGTARIRTILNATAFIELCADSSHNVVNCSSSSLKWKTNVRSYYGGLDVIRRLRPISFNWKEGGLADIGLGAEEVAKVAPSFALANNQGEIEGVRYNRLNILLINAVKEQQSQIEAQQKQIDKQNATNKNLGSEIEALKSLICRGHRRAAPCHAKK